jgi:predicted transcriptional regulator
MNEIRRTIEIDAATDERLRTLARERGQDVAAVIAEAVALLDHSAVFDDLGIEEDRRRIAEFERTGEAVPFEDVKAWMESWGTANELPRPLPRKIR